MHSITDSQSNAMVMQLSHHAVAMQGLVFVYIAGDVGFLAKNLYDNGADGQVMARTLTHAVTFHGIASLALPTVIIHTAVKQSYVVRSVDGMRCCCMLM